MRTSFGTTLRTSDTSTHEATSTKAVASPIEIALTADTVTASVGHMPSIITKVGFCFQTPSRNSSMLVGSLVIDVMIELLCQRQLPVLCLPPHLHCIQMRHQQRHQLL